MDHDRVELARRTYEALNRRDVDGALRTFAETVAWHMSGQFARTARVFRGHQGIREVVALFDEALDDFRVEPLAVHAAGDTVLVEARASGRVRGTGDVTSYAIVNLWRFRDGLATEVEVYATLADGWAAAGMAPPAPSSVSISPASTGRENR